MTLIVIGKEWDKQKGCFSADHLSASQLNLSPSLWFMKYCVWDAKQRKKIPPSVSMFFGSVIGGAVQDIIQHKLSVDEVMGGKKNG